MNTYMVNGELQASKIIEYDSADDLVINLVYCIILAVDKHYTVEIVPDYVKHKKFIMKDFIIRRWKDVRCFRTYDPNSTRSIQRYS